MRSSQTLIEQIVKAADRPGPDLAAPAFLVARIEYPHLDPGPYLDRLEEMGDAALHRVAREALEGAPLAARVDALNAYLFGELGFFGNRERYDDPRNSCLNEVLDRRTGIPITLSLVYIEVARRAGIRADGINFPGHFLVRVRPDLRTDDPGDGLIVDPFHGGAILSELDCRRLLERHLGTGAAFDRALLAPASRKAILIRMLLNLKRLYVQMRSFPQARQVTDVLLALNPSSLVELRDRGLLAAQMQDFAAALRDLEQFLTLSPKTGLDEEQRREQTQVWEQVKLLKRRLASLN